MVITTTRGLAPTQIAIMQPYFDAGLKELARVSGYPIAAIQTCSKFKRTHHFIVIVEAWEAMYQVMVTIFFEYCENGNYPTITTREVTELITIAIGKVMDEGDIPSVISSVLHELKQFTAFTEFIEKYSETNGTWKFWSQFVFILLDVHGTQLL